MIEVLAFFLSMVASALIVNIVLQVGKSLPLIDQPNERSSHVSPTLRGGGVAIVGVVTASALLLWNYNGLPLLAVAVVVTGALLVGGIGLADDLFSLTAGVRLIFQLVACCIVLALTLELTPSAEPTSKGMYLRFLLAAVQVIGMLWLLNLYNFMDGIDGIAGVEGVFAALAAALLILLGGFDSDLTEILFVAAGACLGFLLFNFPPAKIFMGDVGSGFLGFLFASLAVITHLEGSLTVWTWAIILAVFLVDASLTLAVRLVRGERVYRPHRSHAYQNAARRFGGHRPVTIAVALINVFWVFPLAWLSTVTSVWAPGIVLIAWAPLLVTGIFFGAGRPDNSAGN